MAKPSNDHLNPDNHPSGLDADPSAGVLRMNKLPLAIIGGVALIVILALVYAAMQRGSMRQGGGGDDQEPAAPIRSTQTGANTVLQGYGETGGTIPARGSSSPRIDPVNLPVEGDSEPDQASEPPPRTSANNNTTEPPPPPSTSSAMTEEEADRMRRARQFREDLFYDAVVSNTAIQLPDQDGSGSSDSQVNGVPGALGLEGMAQELQRRREQALQASAAAGGGAGGAGAMPAVGGNDPNMQARKEEFQQTSRTYGYSSEFRRSQLTPYEVRVGSIIPGVMISGINSDLPGQIVAQVSQDVRDTRTGQHVLIPQGSRLIGTYDSQVAMGQERVMVAWHRIQFPDSSTLELGNMGGVDPAGYAGFTDQVNNHYWRIFGNATLLSMIGAGAQLSQAEGDNDSGDPTANQQLAAELGRQWGQVGQQVVSRNLNIQPTLEIRPGYQFNIMVNKDLILEPYTAMEPGS